MSVPPPTDRSARRYPLAMIGLVLGQFALFGLVALVMAVRGPDQPVLWYANLSLTPSSLRWYTPLTYSFLHENVFHLSVNMLFLWIFGGGVENAVGWKRFLGFYLVAAIVTGLLESGMTYAIPGADRTTPLVGASGAISGLVGVFAVRYYRSSLRITGLPGRIPGVLLLAMVLLGEMGAALWNLFIHTGSVGEAGVQTAAHWAHIGGFILGMIWAQATRLVREGRHEYLAADAAAALEHGSPLAAVQRLETLLEAQPDNFQAEADLGRAWALADDREQSLTHYRRAISGLLRQGEKSAAAARYVEMTGFFPDAALEAAEQFAVAGALEEMGDYAQAAAAFHRLVRTYPDVREAQMSRLRLGVLYLRRLNDPASAAQILTDFITCHPQSEWRDYVERLLLEARRTEERDLP